VPVRIAEFGESPPQTVESQPALDVIVEKDVRAVVEVDKLVGENAPIQRHNDGGETGAGLPGVVIPCLGGEIGLPPVLLLFSSFHGLGLWWSHYYYLGPWLTSFEALYGGR
jgi:hypothetical protein